MGECFKKGDIVIGYEGCLQPVIGVVCGVQNKSVIHLTKFTDGNVATVPRGELRKIDLSNILTVVNFLGDKTIEVSRLGTVATGKAKCSPKDNFNFLYGLCLAASRIKKPWPQVGETVYYIAGGGEAVDSYEWSDDCLQKSRLANGRVFKTRKAAKAALAKIKKVFEFNKEALKE